MANGPYQSPTPTPPPRPRPEEGFQRHRERDPWSKAEVIAVVAGVVVTLPVAVIGGLYALYATISEPIESLEEKMTQVQADIANINERLVGIGDRLTAIEGRLEPVEQFPREHIEKYHTSSRGENETAVGD